MPKISNEQKEARPSRLRADLSCYCGKYPLESPGWLTSHEEGHFLTRPCEKWELTNESQ